MKRRKLLQHLIAQGCEVGGGKRHTRVRNPANGNKSFVPRHTEIKLGTARGICKALGVPPPPER
jgi:HicA toxin of bacterial toxin-antitoxin,